MDYLRVVFLFVPESGDEFSSLLKLSITSSPESGETIHGSSWIVPILIFVQCDGTLSDIYILSVNCSAFAVHQNPLRKLDLQRERRTSM